MKKVKITNKPNKTLYIYCRVSTTKQDEDGISLDVQKENGLKVSKRLGLKPISIKEQGSGLKPYIDERPLFSELMDNVVDGKVKHLWIDEDTRLTRNDLDQPFIHSELKKYDVNLYLGVRGEKKNLDDFGTRLVDMVRVMINQNEIRKQVRKSIKSKVKLFNEGKYMKGDPPFGYKLVDKKLEIHEENSEWVRKIFDWYDGGKSSLWIREELFRNQVPPPRSKSPWFPLRTISVILGNKNYIGIDVYHDKSSNKTHYNKCPKIIEKDIFNSIRKRLDYNKGQYTQRTNDFLLRGVIKCSDGTPMFYRGINKTNKNELYVCNHRIRKYNKKTNDIDCPITRSVRVNDMDDFVWLLLCETLSHSHNYRDEIKKEILGNNPTYTKRTYNNRIKKLNKKMMDLDTNRLELEKRFYTNQMDKGRFDVLINHIQDEENKIIQEINDNEIKLSTLRKRNKWIDWLDVHFNRIDELKLVEDMSGRKEWIIKYIHEIIVLDYDKETKQHTIVVKFRFPLFNDNLDYKRNKDGSFKRDKHGRKIYTISDGDLELTNPLVSRKSLNSDAFGKVTRSIHIASSKYG
jgi:site-specific DNA recombinase